MNQACIAFTAADLREAAGQRSVAERAADVVLSLANGKPVTRAMVSEELGIGPNVASKHLWQAYRQGLIEPANKQRPDRCRLGWYPVTQEV